VQRGDIYHVDLNPIKGREQAGARFVPVFSPKAFNLMGTPLVCRLRRAEILRVKQDLPSR
jgi:mRNA-degrading endonuclease toxin of MazEF toxin-antitoxin module